MKITDSRICVKRFTFFEAGKCFPIDWIRVVEPLQPTMENGKYRYFGSGDFSTWFPWDFGRSRRKLIFKMSFHRRWHPLWKSIGFTVEDEDRVMARLVELGLTTAGDTTKPEHPIPGGSKTASRTNLLFILAIGVGLLLLILGLCIEKISR